MTEYGQKSEHKCELCCVSLEFRFYTLNFVHKTLFVHICLKLNESSRKTKQLLQFTACFMQTTKQANPKSILRERYAKNYKSHLNLSPATSQFAEKKYTAGT